MIEPLVKPTPPLPQLSERSKLYSIESLIVTSNNEKPATLPDCTAFEQQSCKYATTPLHTNRDPGDCGHLGNTHSPQLPAPSPNYPVPDTPDKAPESGQQQRRRPAAAHVPNTDVPIHITHSLSSDNDAPRQPTSQTDVCKQTAGPGEAQAVGNNVQNNNNHHYVNNNKSTTHDNSDSKSDDSLKSCANSQEEHTSTPHQSMYNCNNIESTGAQITTINMLSTSKVSPVANGYVLIVPQFNMQANASNARDLLAIRRTRSKLDLAAKRRRLRRELRALKSKRSDVALEIREEPKSRVTIEYGLKIHGYSSESSSSEEFSTDVESDLDLDLWIRTGPPSKLSISEDKTGFLNIFGLTTHHHRSEIELKKLERRKWAPPVLQFKHEVVASRTDRLELPVPFESPSLLNRSADFPRKAGFFHGIGLRTVNTRQRLELEKNWLKVVQQRLKRNALTSLNNFYQRFGEKVLSMKEKDDVILSIPKFRDNAMQTELTTVTNNFRAGLPNFFTDCSSTNVTNVLRTIPHATLFSKHHINQGKLLGENYEMMNGVVLKQPPYNEVHFNGTLMHGIVPPEMNPEAQMASARQAFDQPEQQPNQSTSSSCSVQACITSMVKEMVSGTAGMTIIDCDCGVAPSTKGNLPRKALKKANTQCNRDWATWPGLNEMMTVYQKFASDRNHEILSLQKKCEHQRQIVEQQQAEVKRYEARQTELRKISTTGNLKRHNIEKALDRLTKILADFKPSDR